MRTFKDNDFVIRYTVTYKTSGGVRMRTFSTGQGACTWTTREEAQSQLDVFFGPNNPNSADTIRQLFGDNPDFAVRPVRCWATNFDPISLIEED